VKRIVLHIDRLVLRGFHAADRDGIAQGLRAELGRLLADPASHERLGSTHHVPRIDAGRASVHASGDASQTGAAVGVAVGRGLTR
jgi:hypothetical protein